MFSISTITPVYKGEKYVSELVEEIEIVRNNWNEKYEGLKLVESIFVIDDASDKSLEILSKISETKDWVHVIELSKNFGQHPATVSGILHSVGDWVVTLDEDLQHSPDYIDELILKALESNQDICYAKSIDNTHNSFVRDKISSLFKSIIAYLSGDKNIKKYNSYRVIRGNIARGAASIAGHGSYFDIVLSWFTSRSITHEIPMEDDRNQTGNGKSGYSVIQLIKHGKRMIMTSKVKFLRLGIIIGGIAFLASILLSFYAIYARMNNAGAIENQGWASQILATVFFGGLTILLVGFVLESVSDILLTSKGKPNFFVVDRSSDTELKKILKK